MQDPLSSAAEAAGENGGFLTQQGANFAAYYEDLRKRKGVFMPRRSDFSPPEARSFLPYLFIEEAVDQDTVIFRHIGTVIVARTGADGTGLNFFELMSPEVRLQSWWHIRHLLDTPCGSRMLATEPYSDKHLVVETVSFPFANKEGEPRFIFATAAEVDLQQLAMRGEYTQQFGDVISLEFLDLGRGV